MPAPFFMVGPTAVGKSSLAVAVAARCGAEIMGADAFQIYAGFDLLTAKPTSEERRRVPHHLIGTVPPGESYHVARYLADAQRCLESVFQRKKPVIVVGGTGLYVKALTHGLSPLPPANPPLRAELEALDALTLLTRLQALDPVAADSIDIHNKRRLIRAVEVCLLTGSPFSNHRALWQSANINQPINGFFLVRSKTDLQHRITRRVDAMFAAGVLDEVCAASALPLSPTASQMIGLQPIRNFLAGQQTLDECRARITVATRQYAKRQMTWFQREKSFEKIDLTALPDEQAQITSLSARFTAFMDRGSPAFSPG